MSENKYDHLSEYARTLIRVKARQLVRRPEFSRADTEDIEQDLAIQIHLKIAQYDPSRSSLNTFLARVVDSSISMMIRERGRLKRGGRTQKKHSIDHESNQLGVSCVLEQVGTSLDVSSVIEKLPTELRQLCRDLMTEKRAKVIKQRRTTKSRYESSLNRIREHFQKNGINRDHKIAK
jgi:DNA-directed RNA polymerase specialized sigma24 family protein